MLIRTLPTRPWQIIGSDLFQYANRHYIILVDYYSSWPEVYLLRSPNSKWVVEATKEAFAHLGISEDEVISENGSQYSSREYQRFSKDWEFQHTTSSPHYPKSNGLAEATVKIIKVLIKKSNRSNKDIQKGLLIIRNTPLSGGKSSAELLKVTDYVTIYHESIIRISHRMHLVVISYRKGAKQKYTMTGVQ